MEIVKKICPSDKGGVATFEVTGISLPEVAIQIRLTAYNSMIVSIIYFGRKMANYYYSADNKERLAKEMARDINLIFKLRGKKISTSDEQLLPIIESACVDKPDDNADITIYFN
jgi:hypothetical protein